MLPSLLFSIFSTLTAAVTLPFREFELELGSVNSRSLDSPQDLLNRQSTFSCNNGYDCYDYQTCCGTVCCNSGYECNSAFTCDPTCSSDQQVCGSKCCSFDDICNADTSTCFKNHKLKQPSGSSSDSSSGASSGASSDDKLPTKALGGIVAAAVSAVTLVCGVVAYSFRRCLGCFGKKRKAYKSIEQDPLAYGLQNKNLEPEVQRTAPR